MLNKRKSDNGRKMNVLRAGVLGSNDGGILTVVEFF